MTLPFSFFSVFFLLCAGPSVAQTPARGGAAGETLHVRHTADFVVTGEGNATEWNQTDWVVLPRRTGASGPEQTRIKILYSDSGIYCLYHCADKKITATLTTDFADLYNEDVVEAFFRSDDNVPLYFEYELSPLGYELPLLVPNIKGDFLGWLPFHYAGDRKTRHAAHISRSGNGDSVVSWTAEFFIPYALLKPMTHVPPHSGTRWKANFYRIDYDQGVVTWQWNLVRNEMFHDYERFGTIVFDSAATPDHRTAAGNPAFIPNTVFVSHEDLASPKFAALKEKYQLDTIFHGETDEFKRILLLRNWIRSKIRIDDIGPYPGDGSAESILDYGLKGYGFHCGHYMLVQNAIMNAYGYVTRCLGAGPGGYGGKDFHHGINEIWLNSYGKWFLSDAKYDHHFEKNGVPLSALEVRAEFLKNGAADIKMVNGPGRVAVDYDKQYGKTKKYFAGVYVDIEWNQQNDLYVHWPTDSSYLIMYNDNYFKQHTWIWDGKPHWAYHTPHMVLIADRKAIEWTPNTVATKTTIRQDTVDISATTCTPNFRTFQLREPGHAEWKDIPATVSLPLERDKNEFDLRIVNTAGVTGPVHKVVVEKSVVIEK